MGCGSSKEDVGHRRARHVHQAAIDRPQATVSAPSGGPQMVPPPYRDASGRPIVHQDFALDRITLVQALNHMGEYLDAQGVSASVFTVGGAVNTIFFRSRQSTHDVDFFMEDPESPVHRIVYEAARSAARSSAAARGVTLGANWFNNATQLFMSRQIQANLAREALRQNTVIHSYRGSRGGIVVYAAPWAYAFCGKLNRLCEASPRTYDVRDAIVYLHEHLRVSCRTSVNRNEILQWCREYRKNVTDAVLDQINNQYFQEYGRRAIDW